MEVEEVKPYNTRKEIDKVSNMNYFEIENIIKAFHENLKAQVCATASDEDHNFESQNFRSIMKKPLPFDFIFPVQPNYSEILNIIKNAFSQKLNQYILLIGGKGVGKFSQLKAAIKIINVERQKQIEADFPNFSTMEQIYKNNVIIERLIKFVSVDALVYNKEKKILNEIVNQLQVVSPDEEYFEANPYARLMSYFKRRDFVIYIRNADVFANENRQTFLYSLLDNFNSHSVNSVVVFGSRDIMFTQKLEKRVKSRMNYKQLMFNTYPFETILSMLNDIFQRTFPMSKPADKRVAQLVGESLFQERIKETMAFYHESGYSIAQFKQIIINCLFSLDYKQLAGSLTNSTVDSYVWSIFEETINSFDFQYQEVMVEELSYPQRLCIYHLEKTIREGQVKYSRFLADVNFYSRNHVHRFSNVVYKQALKDLNEMKLVKIDRLPISQESNLCLLTNLLCTKDIVQKVKDELMKTSMTGFGLNKENH